MDIYNIYERIYARTYNADVARGLQTWLSLDANDSQTATPADTRLTDSVF